MNAETGRPRLFCNEFHRKWYAKATADQAAALVAEADATCAVREIRDLQHDLLALLATCQRLARRLELVGDVVTRARIAAVADELGRTLARHFAAQEQP
jgi:hypothetical protein